MTKPDPLTRREREIMDILHRRGRATAHEVLDDLDDPPSYSAVRTFLRLLEERGHVRHEQDGPRYIYMPTVARREAQKSALDLLAKVALPDPQRVAREYPHRLSGGMKQRAMVAMALACGPAVLIADEPTTALDATTQREILLLLNDLRRDTGMGVLLITHDLGLVGEFADHVYVMYAGKIVEHAPAAALLAHPRHPYTQALLSAVPIPDPAVERKRRRQMLIGEVPSPERAYAGCAFADRCPIVEDACRKTPVMLEGTRHQVACLKADGE